MGTAVGSTVIISLSSVSIYGLRQELGEKAGKKNVCIVTSRGKEQRKAIHADNILCSSAMPESQPTNRTFISNGTLYAKLVSPPSISSRIRLQAPKQSGRD